ncbi:hypothetical protein [Aurantiacibacter poecillastricola]|uniref:hypothetical protein n=1 Tax=Aurantiacibacter poecillastricola TaxID=3064385 RepID=UPI00273FA0EE|nr:hypothetical protein [Aurantiacibacter sp. 219JJ12-13]MDP5262124.1 hypothetical protein [Aurantiacibacter sp. 219JJ12-13]
MDKLALRRIARVGLAIASLSFIGGGALIWLGSDRLGDGLMIFGGAGLLVFALLLAKTPTGDKDAG